ncbi:hypothetical protein H3H37_12550 [Duganella sp. LX20W]|uniref:Uncharacterized protein n=1 Tax=Rugamonas brunnea TaxID=2758569 RepID=A0A7W2ESM8_9BURK|nr:hypothetical protein [Rugamonas brunnea]MBA5637884.1 hypothetical protein [Rugamonas brunnea]
MRISKFFLLFAMALIVPMASTAKTQPVLPKQVCDDLGIEICNVSSVDAFSEIDLNGDGAKEVLFAYSGGACGEQHWIYTQRNSKWVEIANWCGMDGGGYKVLSVTHNGFLDIDTLFGVIRFDGKQYTKKTKK